ncbi:3-phenylpropionate/trans-cinnamate dioxygenase ferredoxin reductase subunit [Nocardioides aromaticivorans]|uniref:3-phenylpropionate/trans-cinnamate dioxygenase ferredoxin reductase subunit n=2 Tax=Nocardioides aromaticivorans TaxID=200618 RepID=A0A7Y9ZGJ2_9ACTN|nr:3-phenylpropionate/trans-cinnamate dioxygenase ferredoxin reductase subunit [Nocardioides aromaticivorans]
MSTSVAIIGGGQGGASVAQALRNRGYAGGIHLFSAEDVLPYERPPLSKGMLCGGDAPTWVLPEEFYDTQRIELHLGSKVTDVRSAGVRHMVVVDGAPVLEVDEVVLATGSVPRALRIPGTELRGVHALSCVADLGALLDDLGAARRVVIGGGGFIGAEVASGLVEKGVEVVVVDPVASPMAARTAAWVAHRLEQRHRKAGVRSLTGTVVEVRGRDRVESVLTGDGHELPCDVFLVAIGSRPATELAERMGLPCPDGVLCDDRGRTATRGVHAIGDVASWLHPALGRTRIEHYRTAIDHADVVAADIVGADIPALRVPWFWTDQYEHRVEVAGRPSLADQVVERPGASGETALSLHLADGRVVGVVGIDVPRDVRTASRFIDNQDVVDPSVVADPTIDLRKAVMK